MITPRFSLDQDENQLIITIIAPYTNVKDTEINVEENDVRFYSAPYYLRLALPGNVEETDTSSANYVSDESKFIIRLDKSTPGEIFPNLELLTTFLQPMENKKVVKNLIEVINDGASTSFTPHSEIEENDWYIEQNMEEDMSSSLLKQHEYGFANKHKGLWTKYEVELGEIADILNPDSLSPAERNSLKRSKEQDKFSDDHYLSDLLMDNDIPRILEFSFNKSTLKKLSSDNTDQLCKFGNREFLLDKEWIKRVQLGLVDIMFAYCYDWRTSEGSHTIESPWNVSRISGTLGWFVTFDSVKDMVLSCMRRSLSYPLYRNWDLSKQVFNDVITVLKSGPTGVLICLLDIFNMFSQRDPYYLHNQLYIEEYCVWVQKVSSESLSSIIPALKKTLYELKKEDVEFDLCELELAAKLVEDEEMEEELAGNVESMHIAAS